jgi:hypothetical protein
VFLIPSLLSTFLSMEPAMTYLAEEILPEKKKEN